MHHPTPGAHDQHDLELIAGHAAGDLSDAERNRADELLRSCTPCADLRRDLVAIAAATGTLPAQTAHRDFRLTDAQAASLRRGGWVKSLLRPLAAPRSTVRPIAMAFTSLGLAGLLVTNILPALLGGLGSAASLGGAPAAGVGGGLSAQEAASAAPAAPAPAASAGAAASAPLVIRGTSGGPQATDGRNSAVFGSAGQPTAALDQLGNPKANQASAAPGDVAQELAAASAQAYADRLAARERLLLAEDTMNPVFVGSLVLLALGLALFGLRFLARRVR
jgi:hypothetical protein